MSQEIEQIKTDMKVFSRALASGDSHFKDLDKKVDDIKENMIKVNYALFGNGVNGVTQNIELILKRIDDFAHSCKGEEHGKSVDELKKLTKEQGKLLQEHEDIVKLGRNVLWIFKYVGIGSLILIGTAIGKSVYNLIISVWSII